MPEIPTMYIAGDCKVVGQVLLLHYLGIAAILLVAGYLIRRAYRSASGWLRSIRSRADRPTSYARVEVIEPGEWQPQDEIDILSSQFLRERVRQFMSREEW